jgi:hypothetical protein
MSYYYHENYEHLILMEDGALMHCSNLPKIWKEELALTKLNWPVNSHDLNPIETYGSKTKIRSNKQINLGIGIKCGHQCVQHGPAVIQKF